MSKLTQIQADTLYFIKQFIAENSYPPSNKEIADEFGVYSNAIQRRIDALVKKGAITRREGKMRSIAPVKGFRVRIK